MTEIIEQKKQEKIVGRITKVHEKGWGFIISDEIKFTKFFFHWTGLTQNTKKFTELTAGMKVKFIPINIDSNPEPKVNSAFADSAEKNEIQRGPRAIKIEVI